MSWITRTIIDNSPTKGGSDRESDDNLYEDGSPFEEDSSDSSHDEDSDQSSDDESNDDKKE